MLKKLLILKPAKTTFWNLPLCDVTVIHVTDCLAPPTDIHCTCSRKMMLCQLYCRAVVKSTFVESKTSPSPKWFESESRPSPKRFESESRPSPKRFESESSPSPKRFESESRPSPKRFESESRPSPKRFESKSSPSPNETVKTEKVKNYLLQNHILNY